MTLSRLTKKAGALFLGASLALGLTACGSSSADGGLKDDEKIAKEGELEGDLVMWSSFTQGPRAEWMEAKAKKFHEAHPKVNIKIETFSWDEFNTKWTTGLTSGQVPDLSTALPNQVVDMINAQALVPVDDVVDEIGRERFPAPALKEGENDGKNYSVPIYSHAQVMWYRKDILKENNLEVPKTWSELAAAAEKIGKKDDFYALSVPMGTNDLMAARYLNFYVRSKGETLLNDDGTANLTSPAAQEGIKYWTDLFKKVSPQGSVNYNVLDQATLFYQGKTAFDFNSGFHISGVESNRPDLVDQIAAAPLPTADGGKANYPAEVSNIATVVWQASDKKPVAKAFLKSLYDDDDYIDFLHSVPGGMLPVLSDVNENKKYLDNDTIKKFEPSIKVISDQVKVGSAIGMEEGPKVQAGILTSQGVIERMFQSIVLENKDPMDAAKKAEDELNSQFKSAGADIK